MAISSKPELLTQIRDLLFQHFNRGEFNDLCFQLGERYDDLPEGTLTAQIREFLLRLDRANRLPDLLARCSYVRPKVDWPDLNESIALDASPAPFAAPDRNPRQIFLSHAGADAEFAHRLADELRRHGWEIWIAPDSIQPGEEWVNAINNGLAASGVFLLVLTPDAVKSSWVYKETNVAINLQNQQLIRLIPLEVKPVNAPPLWQAYQWIPFQDAYKDGLERLLQVLQPEKVAQAAGVYQQMEQAVSRSDWALAQKLGEQINGLYPDYRETEALLVLAEREEKRGQAQQVEAAQLYPRLQAAVAAEEWPTALTLAAKMETLVPSYQDVPQLAERARKGQRQSQREARQQWLKQIPTWGWGGGAALALVLIFIIAQWVAGGKDAPTTTPSRTSSATPTLDLNVPPANAQLGSEWTRPKDGMVMVYVPGGTFMMGSTEAEFEAAVASCNEILPGCVLDREELQKAQEVTLAGFWIDKYEVSNAQYQLCVAAGACEASEFAEIEDDYGLNAADHPVVGVSWFDAAAYSAWVGGTLPTEAEWEYAARGPERFAFPWGNKFDGTLLNICDTKCEEDGDGDDGYVYTAPIGSYPAGASWVGAQDMAGNVSEWTDSWLDGSETRRVCRSGAWYDNQILARAAVRTSSQPDISDFGLGFRVVVRRSSSS